MSRSARAVQAEMFQVQPPGWTFPDDPDSYWGAQLLGWASEAALIEASMEAMLPQVDLRVAYELLPDYQRVLGPDPCGRDLSALSFADQAAIAFTQWTAGGNLCAGTLVRIAAALGVVATVTEAMPWICGASSCDDEMVPAGANFMIGITLPQAEEVTYWECGVATCDDSLGIAAESPAQCPIEHACPVHVLPAFSYTG